jgi:hypothetical protein
MPEKELWNKSETIGKKRGKEERKRREEKKRGKEDRKRR